jgi:3-methyl-2-oxobutanoate hydroxymethyltransferase
MYPSNTTQAKSERPKKTTVADIRAAKAEGRPVTMSTAYDALFGALMDEAGIEVVLVGDSVGMTTLGMDSTVAVTMDEMLHHVRAVRRGCKRALVVGDLPFMSFNVSIEEAIRNAGRLIKEAGADCVKLEGGAHFAPTVAAIVKAGIPVQGHIGLLPQTASSGGGFKVQGKTVDAVIQLIADARALEAAGAFSIILEAVPAEVGAKVAQAVSIPVIGVGAGPHVDGQCVVMHDLLGLYDAFTPKFAKVYAKLRPVIVAALSEYRDEILDQTFPGPEHSYEMPKDAAEGLKDL